MGTRGLKIVRFRGRYYIQHNQYDSYFEGLGAQIVASIPPDPEKYQKWLKSMRERYATQERVLNESVYEIHDGSKPEYSQFREFEELPSELTRLDDYDAEYFYIIDLDREVLSMNFGIHWRLGNIPRQNDLWLRAIRKSLYQYKSTISLDVCSEEHIASLALELPKTQTKIGYTYNVVTPKTDITGARKVFLTFLLAKTLIEYRTTIIRFGREWSPDSFPFRELAFALVSIASDQAKLHSFPVQLCKSRYCPRYGCNMSHLPNSCGLWLDKEWAGDYAPLPEFGSMCHRPGDPPGASPVETMYWFEDVLVSLTLVVDGEAITNAVTWGIKQGRASFQLVVLSLFEVAFVEVFVGDDDKPFIKISKPVNLSPLRPEYCTSTHPRERPELKPGMEIQVHCGEVIMRSNCTASADKLQSHFPGLVSLVNFFDIAASRRATSRLSIPPNTLQAATQRPSQPVILPTELHDRILDFVDYDTWRSCLFVSPKFRSYCLRKFRLDDRTSIIAGPFTEHEDPRLSFSFDFENTQTGKIFRMMHNPGRLYRTSGEFNWMPVIGSDRKALLLDVVARFKQPAC